MKVEETIYQVLKEHGGYYRSKDPNKSRFAILHHMFIVLGNGIEWAKCKKPEDGGYLCEPKYKKVNGEWVRKFDKPYLNSGVVVDKKYLSKIATIKYFTLIPKHFTGDTEVLSLSQKELEALPEAEKGLYDIRLSKPHLDNPEYDIYTNPYPNFQEKYSCFWESGVEYIKEDWRLAAIEHLEHWLEFFTDEVKSQKWVTEKMATSEGLKKSVAMCLAKGRSVEKDWELDYIFDGDCDRMAKFLNDRTLQKSLKFLTDTILKLKTIGNDRKNEVNI